MKTSTRICVLGSINLDLIIQTQDLPQAGQTVGGGEFSVLPGGKGANVAVAAKRLGADVLLCGATGMDSYAEQARVTLEGLGVDLSKVVKLSDTPTGVAFINVSDVGENQIAVASGANGAFQPQHIGDIQADALITQFEIPIETIEAALKTFEGFVCVNPSPVCGILIAKAMPPKVDVIDTTGAGDAFAAAITTALAEGQSPQEALQFACVVGALTTTQLGTQTASPERTAVETVLEEIL